MGLSGIRNPPDPRGQRIPPPLVDYNETLSPELPQSACRQYLQFAAPEAQYHPGLPLSNYGDIWSAQIGLRPHFVVTPNDIPRSNNPPNLYSITTNTGGI